jgi:hypothetical protein
MKLAEKIIDDTSGSFEKEILGGRRYLRFTITGVSNANIKLFLLEIGVANSPPYFHAHIKCTDWGTAKLKIESKTNHPEDYYSYSGNPDIASDDVIILNI